MKEPLRKRYERERKNIVRLHEENGYSFAEIGAMPDFDASAQAIQKRYKREKGLTKG